jgi:hypothetical protein
LYCKKLTSLRAGNSGSSEFKLLVCFRAAKLRLELDRIDKMNKITKEPFLITKELFLFSQIHHVNPVDLIFPAF